MVFDFVSLLLAKIGWKSICYIVSNGTYNLNSVNLVDCIVCIALL